MWAEPYNPLYVWGSCLHQIRTSFSLGGGSVQQGLSAAFAAAACDWHRSAADKRYSLGRRRMRKRRALFMFSALCAGLVLAAFGGEDYIGARVFVRNDSPCDIQLSEEHSGSTIHPGEKALAKSNFVERSPTMLLVSKHRAWTGLHFEEKSVEIRTREGERIKIAIPPQWWKPTRLGRELTFEVDRTENVVLKAPTDVLRASPQPGGFPLLGLPATIPLQKELACQ
jgi:hypothetical protein